MKTFKSNLTPLFSRRRRLYTTKKAPISTLCPLYYCGRFCPPPFPHCRPLKTKEDCICHQTQFKGPDFHPMPPILLWQILPPPPPIVLKTKKDCICHQNSVQRPHFPPHPPPPMPQILPPPLYSKIDKQEITARPPNSV
jgi:hypothetical protein